MPVEIEREFRIRLAPEQIGGRPEVDLLAAWEIWQAYLTQPDAPA